jgi:hypothetical protein
MDVLAPDREAEDRVTGWSGQTKPHRGAQAPLWMRSMSLEGGEANLRSGEAFCRRRGGAWHRVFPDR